MSIDEAKKLVGGDKLIHNGVWAYRVSDARSFSVVNTDEVCIRVVDERGYTSRYSWSGCSLFMTKDFFESCYQVAVL